MTRYALREQVGRGLKVGGLTLLALGAILVLIYAVTRVADVPFTDLTRDAATTLEGPWYTGAISNLTIALAMIGAGIGMFAASLLPSGDGRSVKGLLYALGAVVFVVTADDLLMLHERVFPEIGLSAEIVFGIYGLTLLTIFWLWRNVILSVTDYAYLALAALALGASVIVDVVFTDAQLLDLPFAPELIEDPLKIAGLVFMAVYFISTSRQALLRNAGLSADGANSKDRESSSV